MSNCLRAEKLQIIFYALENNQKPKKEKKNPTICMYMLFDTDVDLTFSFPLH